MSSQGTYLRFAGTEAHHQIGGAECQGSILKEMIAHTVQGRHAVGSQMMRMVVTECACVKNNRVNHGGFSPSQWVLGRLPEEVCSLTAERSEGELGVHQEMLSGDNEFAQQLNIRQAAKESFAHVDSSNRARSALMRRSTPCRGPYSPGDLLCFFRSNKRFGPARMIGREGHSNLWILGNDAGDGGDDGSGSGQDHSFIWAVVVAMELLLDFPELPGAPAIPPVDSQPAQPEALLDDASEYSPGTPLAEEDIPMQPEATQDGLSPDGVSQPPSGLEASPSESPGLAWTCD